MDNIRSRPAIFSGTDLRLVCAYIQDGDLFLQSKRHTFVHICFQRDAPAAYSSGIDSITERDILYLQKLTADKKYIQDGNAFYFLAFSRYIMDLSVCFFTFEPKLNNYPSTNEYSSNTTS